MARSFCEKMVEWQKTLDTTKTKNILSESDVVYLNGSVLYLNPDGTLQPRSHESLYYIVCELLNAPEIKTQIKIARGHFIYNAFTTLDDLHNSYIDCMLEIGYGVYGVPNVEIKYMSDIYKVLTTSPEFKPFIVLG